MTLTQIAHKQHDLKKKLKVTFAGEPGLDMGGLTKEWFLLLVRQIFQQEYGRLKLYNRTYIILTLCSILESQEFKSGVTKAPPKLWEKFPNL